MVARQSISQLIAATILLACLIPKLSRAFSFHHPPQLTPIIVTNEGEFHFEAARRDELIPADKILAVEFITFSNASNLAALRVLIADDSDESQITPIIACVGSKLTVEHAARIFEGTPFTPDRITLSFSTLDAPRHR